MHNLFANFAKILEVCKHFVHFAQDFVIEKSIGGQNIQLRLIL